MIIPYIYLLFLTHLKPYSIDDKSNIFLNAFLPYLKYMPKAFVWIRIPYLW